MYYSNLILINMSMSITEFNIYYDMTSSARLDFMYFDSSITIIKKMVENVL